MNRIFYLEHEQARRNAVLAVQEAPAGIMVVIKEKTRSLDQNALLWPLLTAVSKQVEWFGQYLTADEWKDIFTASLKQQKVVPGIDGKSFVVCGQRTSTMPKSEFSDLIELIYAFGAERGVNFENKGE